MQIVDNMSPHMRVATLSYVLLVIGLLLRKVNRTYHAAFMVAGIVIDLLLVLTLQIQRQAIQTAISLTLSPLQQSHVCFSTLATILYFPTLYYGFRLVRSSGPRDPLIRRRHIRIASGAFCFRTLGFILMFSLIGRHLGS